MTVLLCVTITVLLNQDSSCLMEWWNCMNQRLEEEDNIGLFIVLNTHNQWRVHTFLLYCYSCIRWFLNCVLLLIDPSADSAHAWSRSEMYTPSLEGASACIRTLFRHYAVYLETSMVQCHGGCMGVIPKSVADLQCAQHMLCKHKWLEEAGFGHSVPHLLLMPMCLRMLTSWVPAA